MGRSRWSRVGAWVLIAYGAAALSWGALGFAIEPSVGQAVRSTLFILLGLLAITSAVVWRRAQGRTSP